MVDQKDFDSWLHSDKGQEAVGLLVLDEKYRALRLAYAAGARQALVNAAKEAKKLNEPVEPHEIVFKTDYIKDRKD